jgi:hypothetical protein
MASVTKPFHGFANMPQHDDELSYEFPSGEWECIVPSVDGWLQAMDVVKRIAQEQCEGCTSLPSSLLRFSSKDTQLFK